MHLEICRGMLFPLVVVVEQRSGPCRLYRYDSFVDDETGQGLIPA